MWILQESCTILRHVSEAQKSQQLWYKLGFSELLAADNTLDISPLGGIAVISCLCHYGHHGHSVMGTPVPPPSQHLNMTPVLVVLSLIVPFTRTVHTDGFTLHSNRSADLCISFDFLFQMIWSSIRASSLAFSLVSDFQTTTVLRHLSGMAT